MARKKKQYKDYAYEDIYNQEALGQETTEEKIEELRRSKKKYKYAIKTIMSGPVIETEIYPVYQNRNDIPRREKGKESKQAQRNLNDKNAKKKICRLVNTNFLSGKDLAVTLTYKDHYLPGEEQAKKDIINFINRVKRARKKLGLPELKYIYVVGSATDEQRERGKKVRVHHHIIMNDMDRDLLESLWKMGRAEAKRLQEDDFGLDGIACYLANQSAGSKRWYASRNLKKPKVHRAITKLTKKKAEQLVREPENWREFFESLYCGKYRYNDCRAFQSDVTGGFYLYTKMHRRD